MFSTAPWLVNVLPKLMLNWPLLINKWSQYSNGGQVEHRCSMKNLSGSSKGRMLCEDKKPGAELDKEAGRANVSLSNGQALPLYPSKVSRWGPVIVSRFTQPSRSPPQWWGRSKVKPGSQVSELGSAADIVTTVRHGPMITTQLDL